jgi:adenylate cyclase
VFGLPEPRPDDAARALACAKDLVEVIARWNVKEEGHPAIRNGIGIHYGDLFCGIIGEDMRLEFTVLGDTVNVAARMEQATGDWREVSRVPLRGRAEVMAYFTPAKLNETADLGIPVSRLAGAGA